MYAIRSYYGESPSPGLPGLQAERQNILSELTRQNWNKTRTARELGIAKSTLFEKLKKYRIRSRESDR